MRRWKWAARSPTSGGHLNGFESVAETRGLMMAKYAYVARASQAGSLARGLAIGGRHLI